MRKQLSKIIFILIISLFIHPLISYSQEGPTEEWIKTRREKLKGIEGVYVLIESLPPVTKELGITKELVKTEVELKLRLAGIRIDSREELLKVATTATTYLYVNLNTISYTVGGVNIYAFNISISLSDKVHIARNSMYTLAETWRDGILMISTKDNGLRKIREGLKRLLDTFLNDYLAVNPKK